MPVLYDRQSLLAYISGVYIEFTVVVAVFNTVEMLADLAYPVGVTHGDNGLGDLFRTAVQVVNGTLSLMISSEAAIGFMCGFMKKNEAYSLLNYG